MDYRLGRIADLFQECLRAAAVFERPNRPLVETEIVKKEGQDWVVLAAGLDPEKAGDFFPVSGKRASFASIPLSVLCGAQMSLLLLVRPFDLAAGNLRPDDHLSVYAPGQKIPFVLIREGHVRLTHLPDDNNARLDSIRWELDPVEARKSPMEKSLRDWYSTIGSNPAHPPSHLHFNSLPKALGRTPLEAALSGELRLSMGVPNPIGFILSLSNWLSTL